MDHLLPALPRMYIATQMIFSTLLDFQMDNSFSGLFRLPDGQLFSPSIKANKLQEFTRSSGRDLALDEFYHIQREGADCHDDGHLPSKAHRDNKRQVCREPYVQSRPSLEGE